MSQKECSLCFRKVKRFFYAKYRVSNSGVYRFKRIIYPLSRWFEQPRKSQKGVWFGIVGMAIAILATVLGPEMSVSKYLIPSLIVGSIIGLFVAQRVQMTGMPELVAALHSFVGLAAVFIGLIRNQPYQNVFWS